MWAFILICVIVFIGLFLYQPQKVKQKLYERTKSNSNYVFTNLYFAVLIISIILLAVLFIKGIGSVVPKFSL
jgi:4-hydroxybenzoate polyprenyltransferase